MIAFREARAEDVAAVVALLSDDVLGRTREIGSMADYQAAFARMQAEGANHLVVGELDGRIVATYQITFISGLSLMAVRRAQVESVRVAADLRGQGLGATLFADAEKRARAAGCALMQLTSNKSRSEAQRFYEGLGFEPSHVGYKKKLTGG